MYTKISISTLIFWSLFLQVGINILSPNNRPVKLIFYSFIFDFSLKDIVHMAQNIQECFEDWTFNLFLIIQRWQSAKKISTQKASQLHSIDHLWLFCTKFANHVVFVLKVYLKHLHCFAGKNT